jgi:hypothetical protein
MGLVELDFVSIVVSKLKWKEAKKGHGKKGGRETKAKGTETTVVV